MAEPEPPKHGPAPLLPKQLDGVLDTTSKIIIYRGGYRSGKTTFLVAKAIDLGLRHWPHPVLAIEPSFPMIRSVFVDAAIRLCRAWKLALNWQESKKILTIGRRRPVRIWCRSADAPRSLEGLTVGSLIGDEWELWDREALIVAMARVSIGPYQQIVLGGTPEGFGPGYQLLEQKPAPGTRVIVSKTSENFMVRQDYVSDMRSRLSDEEAMEKLEGERTSPAGRVYTRFDRKVHCGAPCADDMSGHIEIWAGFHEDMMVWAFVIVSSDRFHVVGELVVAHTDSQKQCEMARAWLMEWHESRGRRISPRELRAIKVPAICDARVSGKALVKTHVVNMVDAGYAPRYGRGNAREEDRVASVQKVLGDKRITFDEAAAPFITRCIAQQPKAKGTGKPAHEGGMGYGADVIGHGVMWHSPGFKPATAYDEAARARRWEKTKDLGQREVTGRISASAITELLVNRMVKAGGGKGGHAVRDLGCSVADFIEHIEALWTEGMTWATHGVHGWHLDHIRPLASFDLDNREQFKKAAHFTNYQPLWAEDNKRKGVKWDGG